MRLGWYCVVALAGCFAEAPDLADGSTGGKDCPIGSKGCPCTNGGACDSPLECHQQSQNCYDPDCDAGSKDCPCADGLCLGDLQCIDGYCVEPSGSTGAVSTTDAMTSDPTDTTTGTLTTTVADGTASASSTDPTMTTTVGSSSTVSTTADTGVPPPCEECVLMQTYPCQTTYGACMNTQECAMGIDCIEQGNAATTCCKVIGSSGATWNAWVSCAEDLCIAECEGILLQCPIKV